jgi:hypothetical protein
MGNYDIIIVCGYCEYIILMISDECCYETSYIENVVSLSFYAYVKRPKQSSDATWASILVRMLPRHSSHGHDVIILVATVRTLF